MKLTEKTAKTIKAKGDLFMDGLVSNLMLKSNGKVGFYVAAYIALDTTMFVLFRFAKLGHVPTMSNCTLTDKQECVCFSLLHS